MSVTDITLPTGTYAEPAPPDGVTRSAHVQRIEPSGAWPRVDYQELWRYRGLFFFLVWRDIKARYAQTVLGPGWAILRPVLTMVVFTAIFGNLVQVPSDGVPYAIFSLSGLVAWNYFSTSFTAASGSLVVNKNLITKVYFPRLVVPLAPIFAGLVDLAIAFVVLLAMMAGFGFLPTFWALLVLPIAILAMMLTAAGVGCWLTALNIQYRDVQHLTPFALQVWMYGSPIVYPLSIVPDSIRPYYLLNPMVGVVEGFRASLLGTTEIPWGPIGVSVLIGAVIFVTGVMYFRRTERIFADVA
jgi:lipopolysaccharide transport system permease protein